MMRIIVFLCLCIMLAVPRAGRAADSGEDYLLGPQDRLTIRVHTLRKAAGDAYNWEALTGEFSVGASGRLSMPILGEVDASGVSTATLAQRISDLLKSKAGLTDLPSTSIEVVRYRPFFVIGAVQQPGRYEFQPGLTVLQALGIAQGLVRADDLSAVETQAVSLGGDIRSLTLERSSLQAKLARLDAETAGADAVTYPRELTDATADPRVTDLMREESLRFQLRRSTRSEEMGAVDRAKGLFETELSTLREKADTLQLQEDLAAAELRTATAMVRKGIAVVPRQSAAETARNMVVANQQDLQVSILRAQQEIARSERDLVEIPARYRREAIDDTVAGRASLAQVEEKLATARRLQDLTESRSLASSSRETALVPMFVLTRQTPDGTSAAEAAATDRVQAGDVLTVTLVPRHGSGGEATVSGRFGIGSAASGIDFATKSSPSTLDR